MQIDIADEDITLTSVAATITAGAGCKKIFTSLIGAAVYDPFDEITDEAKRKELLTVLGNNRQVLPYTEPYKVDFTQNMTPNTTWRLYAVPIAEDGTIGKVTYEDFTTKKPVFEGTGGISDDSRSHRVETGDERRCREGARLLLVVYGVQRYRQRPGRTGVGDVRPREQFAVDGRVCEG